MQQHPKSMTTHVAKTLADMLKESVIRHIRYTVSDAGGEGYVTLNEPVITDFVDKHSFREVRIISDTERCYVNNPYGQGEWMELQHIHIETLIDILNKLEQNQFTLNQN